MRREYTTRMRKAHVLIIDGLEKERDLAFLQRELLENGGVHVIRTQTAEEIYAHLSEHRLTDIAVLNGAVDFLKTAHKPHLPLLPYQAGIELSDFWNKPVIHCKPEVSHERRFYIHTITRTLQDTSPFIEATRDNVLEHIAFLTLTIPDLQPMKLPPRKTPAIPKRPALSADGLHGENLSFFAPVSQNIREQFEKFLAGKDAAHARQRVR